MINPRNKLLMYYKDDANPVSEFSRDVRDYSRDSSTFTLKTTDYVFIGYDKPINSMYVELETASTTGDGQLALDFWNGSSWESVDGLSDDSRNFQRSAFIQWERMFMDSTHEANTPEAGMPEAFYFRLSTDSDTSALTVAGWNILFSDDEDLKRKVPCVTDPAFLQGATTHVLIHQDARDQIVQRFRNRGFKKRSQEDQDYELMLPWDLLDVQEVREASVQLALSVIFFNMSDSPDDVWAQKSAFYRAQYEELIEIAQFSFDFDDDGEKDLGEQLRTIKPKKMTR